MYILKTFLREKIDSNINFQELLSVQYFKEDEFDKANNFLFRVNSYYEENNLNLRCELQKI